MKLSDRQREFLGKFIRPEDQRAPERNSGEIDVSKPTVLIGITAVYCVMVFFLVIGVPWQGSSPVPIPPEDLPVAIPLFIIAYIVVIGGLYLRDRYRR